MLPIHTKSLAAQCFLVGQLLGCTIPAGPEIPLCEPGYSLSGDSLCLEETQEELRVLEGDQEFRSVSELASFCADYNAIMGNLVVRAPDVSDLEDLSCLRKVGGHFRLDDMPELLDLSLPVLAEVNGDLNIQANTGLERISLPVLYRVGGATALQYLPELGELSLPALQEIGGFLAIYNTAVSEIELEELVSIGDFDVEVRQLFYVRVNSNLTHINLPQLERVAGVMKISSNHQLVSISMPVLKRLGVGFYLSWTTALEEATFYIEDIAGFFYLQHTKMGSFSMPCLTRVGGLFAINMNENLGAVHLPALREVGGYFDVQHNPLLPSNLVDELVEQLETGPQGPPRLGDNGPEDFDSGPPPVCPGPA
jgi:hypothetical protein